MTISKKRAIGLAIFIILALVALTVASIPAKSESGNSATIIQISPNDGFTHLPNNQKIVGFSCTSVLVSSGRESKTYCYILTQ